MERGTWRFSRPNSIKTGVRRALGFPEDGDCVDMRFRQPSQRKIGARPFG
jgi:hypothetical protein